MKFSIVTAVKDGLVFFKQTARTILSQTDADWEWIVVDDSSSEPIAEHLESLGDDRIRVYKNQAPQGQTKSLNFAISQSHSDWIVRMDGDDLADPRRLEHVRRAIADQPQAALVFSNYKIIAEDGKEIAVVRYRHPLSRHFFRYFSRNNPICHPSAAFRKKTPEGALYLFDERLNNAQDYALWKRIHADHPQGFVVIDKPLISYRLVKSSLSGAGIVEQKKELSAIRNNSQGSRTKSHRWRSLSRREQEGMYAFRALYYRFIGESPEGAWHRDDLPLLMKTLFYPNVFLKAAVFLMGRPMRGLLLSVFFKGIYE